MRVLGSLTALAVLLAPMAGLAQSKPAPVADLVADFKLPHQEFTLKNGLRVIVQEDRKAPIVAIAAWYNVGSKDEPKGKTGFAHLFEHIMLFNGTDNIPNLIVPLRNMGATDWNGTTWFDRTNYFQTVPTPALEQGLYIESERMGHILNALTQERLDAQRGIVQNEKRQGDNNPFGLVFYNQLETLFPEGHPYRHSTIGSMADLDSASLDDVRQWFRDNYGPNNAVLLLAGDIDVPTARKLTERYFGHIARGRQNVPAQAAVPTLPKPVSAVMQDRVANTRLYRTWVVPGVLDKHAVALDVAATVLGGLASSRLDNELVRRDQTAVGVNTTLLPFQRIGLFQVTVDVKPGADVDAVSKRLDALMADFIRTGPTEDEVKRVAVANVAGQLFAVEQVGGFSGKTVMLAEGAVMANDPDFTRKQLAQYAALMSADVTAAMQRWLTRPVYSLRVDPGARADYAEAAATRPPPKPSAVLPPAKPRDPMPAIGEIADLQFPKVERARLSNGMEVVYAQRTGAPVTFATVEFDAGVAADPGDRPGVQSLMLNVLNEGTTTLDARALAEAKERLGASITAGASMDRSAVTLATVSANLAPGLDLLADVVRNPAFAAPEVERLRAQRLAAIASEKTQPVGLAQRALPELIYGKDHPYGRAFSGLGDTASVQGLGRDDLLAAHARWIRPDNGRIFVVSNRSLGEITPLLEARFGKWTASAAAKGVKRFDVAIPAPKPRIILIDRPQSPQSLIFAGAVLPLKGSDDTVTLNAANEVLGNNFLSRINTDLRETKGWSYGLRGYLNLFENQTPYLINAPMQADRTGDSIKALIEQFQAFNSTRGVTEPERERTVNGNTRQLAGSFEGAAAVLGALRTNALYKRPDDYWSSVAGRYKTMTAVDMDRAARTDIDISKFVWVVVGDAAKVRPQLEGLGLPVEVRSPDA